MKIAFSAKPPARIDSLVVGAFEGRALGPAAAEIDRQAKGAVARAVSASRFTGAREQFLDIVAPAGVKAGRVVLAGLGKPGTADELAAQNLGGALVAHLNEIGAKRAAVVVEKQSADGKLALAAHAANVAYGARLRSYRFDKYRTKEKPASKPTLGALSVVAPRARAAQAEFARLDRIADGVFFTRGLVSEPANVIYPATLAAQARTLSRMGVRSWC